MSRMNFSYEALRPPSSQPAAWTTMFAPPVSAPHSDICVSQIACASGALDTHDAEDRHGSPTSRASCPVPQHARTYSGVPNAGAPDFMSTLEVKPP